MDNKIKVKGWHNQGNGICPFKNGSCKVEPLKEKKDIEKIKQSLTERPRDLALFTIGINSGLRVQNLLSLTYRDILTKDGHIKTSVSVCEGKNKKHREFIIGKNTRRALDALLPKNNGDLPKINLDDYIFTGRHGKKMSVQRFNQIINKSCKEAGISGNFGGNTLRKTFAYFLLKRKADIHSLMKILGHQTPANTLKFAGMSKDNWNKTPLRLDI